MNPPFSTVTEPKQTLTRGVFGSTDLLDAILCGDNCEIMRSMPSESVDLVVTSPPYDDMRKYGGHSWDFYGVAWNLKRLLKPGGVIVWVVADKTEDGSETGTSMEQALHLRRLGLNLHDTMTYEKHNAPPTGNGRYYQAWEYMFVLSKGKPKTFNPIFEPRRNACGDKRTHRIKAFQRDTNGNMEKKEYTIRENVPRRNVWSYLVGGGNSSEDMGAHKHPAIFPISLAKDHIASWSNPGDVVLDPFAFRTAGGGGRSLRTRNALMLLAEAIRLDNLERPEREVHNNALSKSHENEPQEKL